MISNCSILYSIKRTLYLLSSILVLSSCASINTAVLGAVTGPGFATKTKKTLAKTIELIDSTETRSVVIVPMIHIGAEKDYEKIGVFLDGLKSRGYYVYHEGIRPPEDSLDSCYLDTLLRKFRKMVGSDILYDYPDMASKRKGWVCQTESSIVSDSDHDLCIDITMDQLLKKYEETHGTIVLDDYDRQCPLGSGDYKSGPGMKGYHWIMGGRLSPRDSLLKEHVLNDGYEKIAVVYGSFHSRILKNDLIFLHGYKIKE